jgi:hypothetical protein
MAKATLSTRYERKPLTAEFAEKGYRVRWEEQNEIHSASFAALLGELCGQKLFLATHVGRENHES